jgi:hypothetical protein
MRLVATALTVLISALALSAGATELRCNHDLIDVGEPALALLANCGEPLQRQILAPSAERPDASVERWTYSYGPGTDRIVTLEGGRVVMVEGGESQ